MASGVAMQQLVLQVRLESGQCCCNAAACTAVLDLRVASVVAMQQVVLRVGLDIGRLYCGLDLILASGVAMQHLVLQG